MSHKQHHKSKTQNFKEKDREDGRKFMIILVVATVALMGLLYFIFAR